MPPSILAFHLGPRFDAAVASHTGYGPAARPENQDNFVVIDGGGQACHLRGGQARRVTVADWPQAHARVAVLDGMGGHGHGREAAEAVAAALLAVPSCTGAAELAFRLDALHAELQRRFLVDDGLPRPGTTLTLLELPPDGDALLYHVGDSRLYELAPDGAHALTVDHVPATAAAMAGRLDEAGWRRQVHGRHAPQIAQAFLLGNAFADPARLSDALYPLTPERLPAWLSAMPDRRALALRPDRAYLLATDGFWSCAQPDLFVGGWPQLLAGCPDAAAIVERLFGAIEHDPPPGLLPDNLTALVVRPSLLASPRPLPRHADETALPEADR